MSRLGSKKGIAICSNCKTTLKKLLLLTNARRMFSFKRMMSSRSLSPTILTDWLSQFSQFSHNSFSKSLPKFQPVSTTWEMSRLSWCPNRTVSKPGKTNQRKLPQQLPATQISMPMPLPMWMSMLTPMPMPLSLPMWMPILPMSLLILPTPVSNLSESSSQLLKLTTSQRNPMSEFWSTRRMKQPLLSILVRARWNSTAHRCFKDLSTEILRDHLPQALHQPQDLLPKRQMAKEII